MGEFPVRGGAVWVVRVGVSLIDREWLRCWTGCAGCEEGTLVLRYHSILYWMCGGCLLLAGRGFGRVVLDFSVS